MYFLCSLAVPGFAGALLGGALTFLYAIATYRFVLNQDERRTLKKGADSLLSSARSVTALVARWPRRKATAMD